MKYYYKNNKIDFDKIWEKIKYIVIKTVISITDIEIPLIKQMKISSCNLFELFGIDILLDKNFKPWLKKVARNPSLKCDEKIETKIKTNLITDILNIIGIIPFSHVDKIETLDDPVNYKDLIEEAVIETLCEFERPVGGFERIFPLINNIKYYRKFIEDPQEENIKLWKMMEEGEDVDDDKTILSTKKENEEEEEVEEVEEEVEKEEDDDDN